MKLIPKVIALCISVSAIVIGGLGYASYADNKSSRLKHIDAGLRSEVSFMVSRIKEKESQIRDITKIISQNRQVKKSLSLLESRGVSQELNELISIYPFINYILIAENDGSIFSSSTRDGNKKKIDGEQLLLRDINKNPLFKERHGQTVAISEIQLDPYLSVVGIDESSSLWFSRNIFKRGKVIGSLVVSISWKTIYDDVLTKVVAELSAYKQSLIAALIIGTDNQAYAAHYRSLKNSKPLNHSEAHLDALKSELIVKKTFPVGDMSLSSVLVFDKQAEMMAINTMAINIAIVSLLGIFIMSLLLYGVLLRVFSRINELTHGTKQLSKGRLDFKIRNLGVDEIGELGRDFNLMVDNLAKTTTSIVELNQESALKQGALDSLKRQKKALEASQKQLELVVNATAVGIWDWQVQTGEVEFNERWAQIIGYTLAELQPTNIDTWFNLAHPSELKKSEKILEEHWQGKLEHYVCEARMKHKEGYWVWVLDMGKVVEWHEDGKPKRMIGTHLDINQQKLDEVALIEAKEAAEDAARAKSSFLASMSHEIRTPMNGVLGMLGLLLSTELDNDQVHRVRVAQNSAESLLTLINDILDFSKIDAGKMDLEYLDFDIRTMLGEFAETMAHQAQTKGLEIILDLIHVEESMVKSDSGRIRQILTNITANAIKFTSEGEVLIQASLEPYDDKLLSFKCLISDTGIGIADDKLEHLFDSFSQVDESTTRQYGGTGLGLAIAKNLCQLMDGDISVSSEVDNGSCFYVEIKLLKSDASGNVLPSNDISNLKVLIIDDNETNREMLTGQLCHWGATVSQASNGPDALTICAERFDSAQALFDIVFIDMQMPEMDGAELAEKLRANKNFNAMKLVMMTSMGHQGDAEYFSSLGFDAYFPKPTTTDDLFRALMVTSDGGDVLSDAKPLPSSHYVKSLNVHNTDKDSLSIQLLKERRLLLVEDNKVNQLVATGVLKQFGFKFVDIADNGIEAILRLQEAASDEPYALVIMDCQMPELDGYETSRQIRAGQAGEWNKSIPIIAMTANAMQGDKEKCLEAGMNDYLTKPISPELLLAKITGELE